MIYNQGAFQILSSVTHETVRSQREEKQRGMILGHSFQIFETFRNLEVDFSINLRELQSLILKLHCFLVNKLTHYATAPSMPLQCR